MSTTTAPTSAPQRRSRRAHPPRTWVIHYHYPQRAPGRASYSDRAVAIYWAAVLRRYGCTVRIAHRLDDRGGVAWHDLDGPGTGLLPAQQQAVAA